MTRQYDPFRPRWRLADALFAIFCGLLMAALLAHWICK